MTSVMRKSQYLISTCHAKLIHGYTNAKMAGRYCTTHELKVSKHDEAPYKSLLAQLVTRASHMPLCI